MNKKIIYCLFGLLPALMSACKVNDSNDAGNYSGDFSFDDDQPVIVEPLSLVGLWVESPQTSSQPAEEDEGRFWFGFSQDSRFLVALGTDETPGCLIEASKYQLSGSQVTFLSPDQPGTAQARVSSTPFGQLMSLIPVSPAGQPMQLVQAEDVVAQDLFQLPVCRGDE